MKPVVHYHTNLVLRDVDRHRMFSLVQPLVAVYDSVYMVCPSGMVTDGGSIPRLAWSWIGGPWTGKHRYAVVFHDAGYQADLECYDDRNRRMPEPAKAWVDRMFRDLLIDAGMNMVRANLMYAAVRVGGEGHWTQKAKS
jgi:hypothetical protein